jgi:preprotein translocase subunit SecB
MCPRRDNSGASSATTQAPLAQNPHRHTRRKRTEHSMSETSPSPEQTAQQVPPLVVNIQYVKDLSFEVPGAPHIYSQLKAQPQVSINLDVQARRVQEGQNIYEVAIVIRAEAHDIAAQTNGQAANPPVTVFVAELTYAGVFTLNGLPENAVEPVLLVECPRILFPFARNILSDVTRDGGFPPVLLQPIDFVALWQSRRQAAAAPAVA